MDQTVLRPSSKRDHWTTDKVRERVLSNKVVVFIKQGKLGEPICGYSEQVLSAVRELGRPFQLVNLSEESSIVAALQAFSGVKELPQIFVDGELLRPGSAPRRKLGSERLVACLEEAFAFASSPKAKLCVDP